MLNPRLLASNPPTPNPRRGNSLQSTINSLKILTPGEALILVGILIGALMLIEILTRALGLAATLAGILMAKIHSRIPTLSGTCTLTLMLTSTLISEEIEVSDGAPISDVTQTSGMVDRRGIMSAGDAGGDVAVMRW